MGLAAGGDNAADVDTGSGTGSLPLTGGHVFGPLLVGLTGIVLGSVLLLSNRRPTASRLRRRGSRRH